MYTKYFIYGSKGLIGPLNRVQFESERMAHHRYYFLRKEHWLKIARIWDEARYIKRENVRRELC